MQWIPEEKGVIDKFLQGEDYRVMYLKVRDELAELQQRTEQDGIETWKHEPFYTTPSKREWQSLTDDEIKEIIGSYAGSIKGYTRELFDKIEAKLREKNCG